MKAGTVITWENRGEWGEDMTATSGTVRHCIRGADGLTYAVDVGNTVIYVHASRVLTPVAARLEYLRGEIRAERISYGEIADLQGLAEHIAPDDVELREWAGLPEGEA